MWIKKKTLNILYNMIRKIMHEKSTKIDKI